MRVMDARVGALKGKFDVAFLRHNRPALKMVRQKNRVPWFRFFLRDGTLEGVIGLEGEGELHAEVGPTVG